MDQVNWAEFFHAVTGLITAITAIMIPLFTYWLKKMLDKQNTVLEKQNIEIATIKTQTNGLVTTAIEGSHASGVIQGQRQEAQRATKVAEIAAEKTLDKTVEKVVAEVIKQTAS